MSHICYSPVLSLYIYLRGKGSGGSRINLRGNYISVLGQVRGEEIINVFNKLEYYSHRGW